MKNLIYQYWDGTILPSCKAGSENMKKYAHRIGAEYLFEDNPKFVTNLGGYTTHFGAFKPIYTESFYDYDNVLFADTDIFVVDGTKENIFDVPHGEIGLCTEEFQSKARQHSTSGINTKNDERWASLIHSKWNVNLPRTKEGLLKVYNSGVVLYSNEGLLKAKKYFIPFKEYVDLINSYKLPGFYTCDQPYLHVMLQIAKMNYVEMNNDWNCFVHNIGNGKAKIRYVNDMRTKTTKFVHIQLRAADHFSPEQLWKITNRPIEEWGKDMRGNPFKKMKKSLE